MLSSLRLTATSCIRPRSIHSRFLATLVSTPVSISSSSAPPPPASTSTSPTLRNTPGADKNNKFIVPTKAKLPTAPRYSAKSSRIKGRSPFRLPKALNDPSTALEGQVKIYLPSVFVRLVRNTGLHEKDPYTATFRTDLRLTKPDISNYLRNVYGLGITSIRTINYLGAVKRRPIGGGYSRKGTTKNYKKVFVTMTEPFWYPEERSSEWCNEHFERDRMEEMRDRKMLKIGDGQKYGVSSPRYRGAQKPRAEIERLAELVEAGGLSKSTVLVADGKTAQRKPAGLKMRKNVMRSREEKVNDIKLGMEARMEELRSKGW